MRNKLLIFALNLFLAKGIASQQEPFLLEQSALRCNSLKGYTKILLAPQYSISNPESCEKVEGKLIKQLEKIGKVVRLPMNDMTGLGNSEGILVFDVQTLQTIDGKQLPNLLGSLSFFTSVTGAGESCGKVETWSAQGISNEKDSIDLIEPLVKKFTEDYRSENKKISPVFYLYSPIKN